MVTKRKEDFPLGVAKKGFDKEAWKPKTELGRKVKSGEIKSIDEIINSGKKILEHEIVDALIENLESNFIIVNILSLFFSGVVQKRILIPIRYMSRVLKRSSSVGTWNP